MATGNVSSSTTDPSVYENKTPSQEPIHLPSNLEALGYTPIDCPDAMNPSLDDHYLQTDTSLLFIEGCGEMGGTIWEYTPASNSLKKHRVAYQFGGNDPSPDKRFQVTLGPAETDGEVRTLLIKDFIRDTEIQTARLPSTLSYVQTRSEFDGRPNGVIEWAPTGSVFAELYSTVPKLEEPFDIRFPVMKRFVPINR